MTRKPNDSRAIDFRYYTLYSGRYFRTFNVLDEGVRDSLAIEVDTSLPAERVVRVLNQLKEWCGLPEQIRLDNGPEFIARKMVKWAEKHNVALTRIQPGMLARNALIERFNGSYREQVLSGHLTLSIFQHPRTTRNRRKTSHSGRHIKRGKITPPHRHQSNTPNTLPQTNRNTITLLYICPPDREAYRWVPISGRPDLCYLEVG